MVKIYLGGLNKASVAVIRSALEQAVNLPFKPKVYHSGIAKYSEFVVAKECSTYGVAGIEKPGQIQRTPAYRYIDCFYGDLDFHNGRSYRLNEEDVVIIANYLECNLIPLITQVSILQICLQQSLNNIRNINSRTLCAVPITYRRLKDDIMRGVVGRLKNLTETRYRDSFFNRYRDKEAELGETGSDLPGIFNRKVIRMQYLVREHIKKLWSTILVPRHETAEILKDRLSVVANISNRQRVLCFDIETSFRPHSTEEQKIITIAAVVHDDFHNAPIESQVFSFNLVIMTLPLGHTYLILTIYFAYVMSNCEDVGRSYSP
jgi:hypothetical protein